MTRTPTDSIPEDFSQRGMDVLDALSRKSEEPKKKKPKKQEPKKQESDASEIEAAIEELRQQSARRVAGWEGTEKFPLATAEHMVESRERDKYFDVDRRGSVAPADVIAPYYGDAFEREVLAAQEANKKSKFLAPDSYSKLFDPVPVEARSVTSAYYRPNSYSKEAPLIGVDHFPAEGKSAYWDMSDDAKKAIAYRQARGAAKRQIEGGKDADTFMRINNFDPAYYKDDPASSLEHELGHHYSFRAGSGNDAALINAGWDETSAAGTHMAKPVETRQAMGSLQREVFKNTGSRIKNREQFLEMVDNPPEYLSPQGRRLLNYAKRLRDHRMGPEELEMDKDNLKKQMRKGSFKWGVEPLEYDARRLRSDDAVLEAIIEGLPSVVENTKRPRRFFA